MESNTYVLYGAPIPPRIALARVAQHLLGDAKAWAMMAQGRARPFEGKVNFTCDDAEDGPHSVFFVDGSSGVAVYRRTAEVFLEMREAARLPAPADDVLDNPSEPPAPADLMYEPATCGTDYLIAERAMRVIERATMLGEGLSAELIDSIAQLADRAGVAFARRALTGEDAPF